jgi:hypothetical protein
MMVVFRSLEHNPGLEGHGAVQGSREGVSATLGQSFPFDCGPSSGIKP